MLLSPTCALSLHRCHRGKLTSPWLQFSFTPIQITCDHWVHHAQNLWWLPTGTEEHADISGIQRFHDPAPLPFIFSISLALNDSRLPVYTPNFWIILLLLPGVFATTVPKYSTLQYLSTVKSNATPFTKKQALSNSSWPTILPFSEPRKLLTVPILESLWLFTFVTYLQVLFQLTDCKLSEEGIFGKSPYS